MCSREHTTNTYEIVSSFPYHEKKNKEQKKYKTNSGVNHVNLNYSEFPREKHTGNGNKFTNY